MNTENLTPEESFAIINKAITNFKINYKEFASIFLLWGWVLGLASLSNFILLKILIGKEAYNLTGPYTLGNWGIFMVIGFVIMLIMLRRINRTKKVFSHLEVYVDKLWQVAAISFFIAIVICMKLEIAPPPLMLLLGGLATTATGRFLKFKPMVLGGIVFFMGSIATAFITNEYMAIIVCIAIVCGYLVPGYLLKAAKE